MCTNEILEKWEQQNKEIKQNIEDMKKIFNASEKEVEKNISEILL